MQQINNCKASGLLCSPVTIKGLHDSAVLAACLLAIVLIALWLLFLYLLLKVGVQSIADIF